MSKANEYQPGGNHYKKMKIQVWDFITSNNIPFLEGNAIKYISRWRDKGGIEDIRKAIHYLEKLIEVATGTAFEECGSVGEALKTDITKDLIR